MGVFPLSPTPCSVWLQPMPAPVERAFHAVPSEGFGGETEQLAGEGVKVIAASALPVLKLEAIHAPPQELGGQEKPLLAESVMAVVAVGLVVGHLFSSLSVSPLLTPVVYTIVKACQVPLGESRRISIDQITVWENLKNLARFSRYAIDSGQYCGIVCVSKDGFRLVGLTTVQRQGEADARIWRSDPPDGSRGGFCGNPRSLTSVWLKRPCWVCEVRLLARSESALRQRTIARRL